MLARCAGNRLCMVSLTHLENIMAARRSSWTRAVAGCSADYDVPRPKRVVYPVLVNGTHRVTALTPAYAYTCMRTAQACGHRALYRATPL
jgi:hypothetical protein